jgi:hypothetical protein
LFGILVIINLVMTTAKVALVQLLGAIFKTRTTTANYLLNLLIFGLLSGPILLTFLVFSIYLTSITLLYSCMLVWLLILVFRFVRGFFIGMALTKFSYLFLFVYLCSLEILPLLVLVKVLLDHAQPAGA